MGVSATHLDWSLVPYLRKSFRKHYNKGIKYIGKNLYPANEWSTIDETMPINEYCSEDDCKKIYNYALEMTTQELEQGVEALFHNLNSLQSRSGNQLPFSSINFGTCTSIEGRLINKALIEGLQKGVGKVHKTSIFPCAIFQVMSGVNKEPGTPNYDLYRMALKCTAHRLYPNYANVDWSGNAGYDRNDPTTYFSTINKTVA